MTERERAELMAQQRELQSIITQLEGLALKIRSGSAGIGAEYCAEAVERAAGKCRLAKKCLTGLEGGGAG